MASISINYIPEEDLDELKRIAAFNNRSPEAEVRHAIAKLVESRVSDCFTSTICDRYGGLIDPALEPEEDQP